MDPFQVSFLKFCSKIHSRQMETIQRKSNAFNIAIVLNAIKEEVKLANVFSSLIQALWKQGCWIILGNGSLNDDGFFSAGEETLHFKSLVLKWKSINCDIFLWRNILSQEPFFPDRSRCTFGAISNNKGVEFNLLSLAFISRIRSVMKHDDDAQSANLKFLSKWKFSAASGIPREWLAAEQFPLLHLGKRCRFAWKVILSYPWWIILFEINVSRMIVGFVTKLWRF